MFHIVCSFVMRLDIQTTFVSSVSDMDRVGWGRIQNGHRRLDVCPGPSLEFMESSGD